mgnify:CR=1 FL=1
MKNILEFIRLLFAYTIFCTLGLFLSVFLASAVTLLLKGENLVFFETAFWSVKKAFIVGPIAAISVVIFIYTQKFFTDG